LDCISAMQGRISQKRPIVHSSSFIADKNAPLLS